MKCSNCGEKTVGIYKEVRQAMAEMGFSKEYLQEQIESTIKAAVNSALGDKITEAVGAEVRSKVHTYGYSREFQASVNKAIGDELAKLLTGKLDIKITPKETGEAK